jgi:hypothetical protein
MTRLFPGSYPLLRREGPKVERRMPTCPDDSRATVKGLLQAEVLWPSMAGPGGGSRDVQGGYQA